jgi:predicted N-acyltransferase
MVIRFIHSIHQLSPAEWNGICKTDYPFLRYDFLAALEDSQSLGEKAGWGIAHIAVYDKQNLIAFMPGYCKVHSYGEYVFDWSWADAYHRYGQQYYPKWINAIPFTPCTGPRLLIADNYDLLSITKIITEFLNTACEEKNWSGWHCLFPDAELHNSLNNLFIPERLGCQFHWFNNNYQSFKDFLASLNSRKRKSIKKERQAVLDQGFAFRHKSAGDLSVEDADNFYHLYRNTYYKRSGHAGYLTREFFQRLFTNMPDQLLLVEAIKTYNHQLIAASLFVKDSQTIYGRYWGCIEEFPLLHFETCYYQGIDYAIQHQLKRFDGGAQGEHKIARGFHPVITYSHHWIQDENFRSAIQHFLIEEAESVKDYAEEAKELLPFRQDEK